MNDEKVKQKVKETFGKNAEKYIKSESHAKGDDLQLLVEWMQPQSNWIVLDIATGGGHVAKTLAPHVATVYATDLTVEMLSNTADHLSKACTNIFYVIADAENLPFLEGTFDVVTCRIAPHHFPNPNNFIKEASRVLKPGGKFLLIDNVAPEEKHLGVFMNTVEKLRDESHVRCLSVNEWKELFVSNGLEEIQSQNRKKRFQFPTWVAVTVKNQQQIDTVEQYILNADEELKSYFSIVMSENEDHVLSHQIDEWMVLCQKKVQ
ncbi:methylase involved in ubiquinone/menaquinone biosynthesis [Schinkia azotoformans MEV2011]|uniref:Methylase involved in ubiquinone/menaquinone biosynthesis n=1 Tax=Schinkia azotoformans MEV2011 TaxID=1348973 RepID=A0A072NTQ5_SCHAZ|nr:class I SAM-dependent methyltransferase [Schinkia azotoformans]KEF36590.1 methylase involved in ubiquinone/menaquinone biosynthesis [Schinkia azotoformans MEV2011]MEC1695555.1 class I SAM-dependent methyltransferase [Schinkia azotoformans]MEC1723950.1 class I SAM-dependent methyltransferase [Schinkia azotoformans]MEC1770932.1 class I SAM-dependent methyltransferase [Schinkia azotoformans]MEC1777883.1 class I SAM-dependent methyltransferase [Schinkia azotoformans]